MIPSAIGLYPINGHNRERLRGFKYVNVINCKQFPAKVFMFADDYRKLQVDVVVSSLGTMYISDYYGESMDRNDISYVCLM